MRLLLDTHIALWAIADSPRLPARAREILADEANVVTVSAANIWEIAVKRALNRPSPYAIAISAEAAIEEFELAGYESLPITAEHARLVETLPLLHGDPFDRILVAQALAEPLRLLTHDDKLGAYSDTIIVV